MNIHELNAQLLGHNTNWVNFGLYFFVCLIIAIIIWGILTLFTPDNPDEKVRALEKSKKYLGYAMLIGGISSALFGVMLFAGNKALIGIVIIMIIIWYYYGTKSGRGHT